MDRVQYAEFLSDKVNLRILFKEEEKRGGHEV